MPCHKIIPGGLLGILGGGVPPDSPNPEPIPGQKLASFHRPDLRLSVDRNYVIIT